MSKDAEEPPTLDSDAAGAFDAVEPSPPFRPDPELITYLERQAKPGEVKTWQPESEVRHR